MTRHMRAWKCWVLPPMLESKGVQADRTRGRDWAHFGQVRAPQQHSVLAAPQDHHRAHVPAAVAADAGI